MNTELLDKVAEYLTNKVYSQRQTHDNAIDRKGMKASVLRILDILLLNAGIVVSTYCMSSSLSILSLVLTGASSAFIYRTIRKIYIDIRVDMAPELDSDQAPLVAQRQKASDEFAKMINSVGGDSWNYLIILIRSLMLRES